MDRAKEQGLIAMVHQAVLDSDQWNGFAAALRESMGGLHANLTMRRTDAPMSELTSYVSGGPMEDMNRLYFGTYHLSDPLPYYRLTPGRAYGLDDMFGPKDGTMRDQLRGLLEPFGDPHLLILRVTESEGANAWLTVLRDAPAFGLEDRSLMERLGVHLAIALAAYARLTDAQARIAAYAKAMDRLNVGLVTLAANGRIIDMDTLVSGLITDGEIMRRDPQGRLMLSDGAAGRRLAAALRDFAQSPHGRPHAIRLSETRQADMLLLPVVDRPATGRFTPVARAYVHIDHRPAHNSLEMLKEMFHLTQSEARLALALGEGHTLAEAATILGLTLQTARTYSKRIFQKTGTRRQAELVRTLLTSTLSLA